MLINKECILGVILILSSETKKTGVCLQAFHLMGRVSIQKKRGFALDDGKNQDTAKMTYSISGFVIGCAIFRDISRYSAIK